MRPQDCVACSTLARCLHMHHHWDSSSTTAGTLLGCLLQMDPHGNAWPAMWLGLWAPLLRSTRWWSGVLLHMVTPHCIAALHSRFALNDLQGVLQCEACSCSPKLDLQLCEPLRWLYRCRAVHRVCWSAGLATANRSLHGSHQPCCQAGAAGCGCVSQCL